MKWRQIDSYLTESMYHYQRMTRLTDSTPQKYGEQLPRTRKKAKKRKRGK